MTKPRVLVFTTAYHPFIGGSEIAIQEITRRLKDRFDFYIVTPRFRRDLPKKEKREEGTVIRLGWGRGFDKWLLPVLVIFSPLRKFHLARGRVVSGTLMWGVDISQGALAAALFTFFHPRVPFIFNIQYGYGKERLAKGRFGLIGLAFKFILGRADHVTAISTHLLRLAREYGYKGPAEVVHNGVDIIRFKVQSSKFKVDDRGPKVVITVSRLVPKNGIDILIRAMAEVRKKIPNVECQIVGDGEERPRLEALTRTLGLERIVRFFGGIAHEEIPRYLHEADLFVRPSRSEGMGNAFVEALAAGLPVIGTPVEGILDIIQDRKTGLFTRVDDPEDLAEKIILLLTDAELGRRVVREGRRLVEERFSWDRIAARCGEIFDMEHALRALKIVIATPLYPPQVGGPARYAKELGEAFRSLGHRVTTVSFGELLRYPPLVRHFFYFLRLIRFGAEQDLLFALDQFSVGLPAARVSFLLRKPLVLRLEGDFLWEQFVERTRSDISLPRFYSEPQPLSPKEFLVRSLSGWAIRRADTLVFSSEWRRSMVLAAYGVPPEQTSIIPNAFPAAHVQEAGERKKVVLWVGRMLYLKNLYRLIRAFAKVNDGSWELHLVGDGPERKKLEDFARKENVPGVVFSPPVSHPAILQKLAESSFFVLPSLSEVGPNLISECLSTNTPFILTKETGYTEYVKGAGLLIDPLNEEELSHAIKFLMKAEARVDYTRRMGALALRRSFREAAEDWLKIFYESIGDRR